MQYSLARLVLCVEKQIEQHVIQGNSSKKKLLLQVLHANQPNIRTVLSGEIQGKDFEGLISC